MKRVVITGMAGFSPIGNDLESALTQLQKYENSVSLMPEWDMYDGLNTKLGAAVPDFELPKHYTRKRTRSMGRVSVLATRTCELALEGAGLLDAPILKSGRAGIAYGSSSGSPDAIGSFASMLTEHKTDQIKANTYIQMMTHTTSVNIAVFFGLRGRMIPTSSACTSGSLALGMAYEAIRCGQQDVMLAGGAEELSATQAAVFDTLFATSTLNETPHRTPAPFDADRDGLVIGEGAASFVLERLDHAQARGAPIIGEIVGFGINSDGQHVTQPTAETMAIAMKLALADANVDPGEIGYVNAHGTATDLGDVAESVATRDALGHAVPISSLKSYMGHTLGACGAIEAWLTLDMQRRNWFAPTINLRTVDPRCTELDYIMNEGRPIETDLVMSNNFAFGGVNTSLIFKKWI
ncbi:MAG: beta-ketoacyl-ACP synthase [Alphaproteobacteria bacterium]|mgnify:FL=1|nr:beta-ketoacyl-ACP synthase [Alphaproteobacteria bacterium]MBO6629681.1 beta-ketoacyl-ACP synthase [Alphaproteobacteria bacterium]MDF1625847.1 beta-ketoacyl-ACP synthase [Parvibaculaceae bacterium]